MHNKMFRISLSVFLISGLALVAVLSAGQSSAPRDSRPAARSEQNERTNLLRFLSAAGITAESLTAAGVSNSQVTTVVSQARVYVAQNGAELLQAFDSVGTLASGANSSSARSEPNSSTQAQLANAKAARADAVAAFAAAALQGLSPTVPQTIANIHANRRHPVPVKYLVVNRTPEQWNLLQNALAVAKTAATKGGTVPNDTESFLAQLNEESAVAAAAHALQHNLQDNKSAWTAALNN